MAKRTHSDSGCDLEALSAADSNKKAKHDDVKADPPAVSRQEGCGFLKLAPEVRNLIYSYMVLGKNNIIAPDRASRKPRKQPQDYLRLAHTCQQIRMEFFPLWYKSHIAVRGADLARFTRDFVANGRFGQSNSAFEVLVPSRSKEGAADFLPVLKLWWRDATPDLRMAIRYDRPESEDNETVFYPHRHVIDAMVRLIGPGDLEPAAARQWDDFFFKAVAAVMIFWDKGPKAKVVMKSRYEEWWMSGQREGAQKMAQSTKWFRKHGLTTFEDAEYIDVVGAWGM